LRLAVHSFFTVPARLETNDLSFSGNLLQEIIRAGERNVYA
jgi:hypothetical protein